MTQRKAVDLPRPPLPYPTGPRHIPHRKNAAEWGMWLILWPIARLMRGTSQLGGHVLRQASQQGREVGADASGIGFAEGP